MFPDYYEAYADWIAQAGGDSLVLPRNLTDDSLLEATFRSINALLIPGGADFVGNGSVDAFVYRAVRANLDDGDFFPIWGTCLGFEYLVDILGGPGALVPRSPADPIVPGYDAEGLALPLNLTEAATNSRLFHGVDPALLDAVRRENVTYNAHVQGIEPSSFMRNTPLKETFRVLGTSVDRNGRSFVALIEGARLPFYGTQFHPEKVEFVRQRWPARTPVLHHALLPPAHPRFICAKSHPKWLASRVQVPSSPEQPNIPRSNDAKRFSRYLGSFFVAEARRNGHRNTVTMVTNSHDTIGADGTSPSLPSIRILPFS
eukprot:scaffold220512_cov23-Tisochrysis_lutea.AAC.2